jgi:hypothetical protein
MVLVDVRLRVGGGRLLLIDLRQRDVDEEIDMLQLRQRIVAQLQPPHRGREVVAAGTALDALQHRLDAEDDRDLPRARRRKLLGGGDRKQHDQRAPHAQVLDTPPGASSDDYLRM